jgi:hypothetical protein
LVLKAIPIRDQLSVLLVQLLGIPESILIKRAKDIIELFLEIYCNGPLATRLLSRNQELYNELVRFYNKLKAKAVTLPSMTKLATHLGVQDS